MATFHLLKIRTSIDIFKNEKCKVTFGLEYITNLHSFKNDNFQMKNTDVFSFFLLKTLSVGTR